MARKTVLVCDNCGREVGEGKGATLRLNYTDARRGSKQAQKRARLQRRTTAARRNGPAWPESRAPAWP